MSMSCVTSVARVIRPPGLPAGSHRRCSLPLASQRATARDARHPEGGAMPTALSDRPRGPANVLFELVGGIAMILGAASHSSAC
jgi:hypothetical protein